MNICYNMNSPKPVTERSKVIITVKREFGKADFYKLYAEYAAVKIKQDMTGIIANPQDSPCISE